MFLSGFVVLYDAGYVLLRPRSCEGGDLFFLWRPYKLYSQVDKLYSKEVMESGDGFNQAQAILNLVEVAIHFTSLYLWQNKLASGDVLAILSQTATLWKTVLYWLNDLCEREIMPPLRNTDKYSHLQADPSHLHTAMPPGPYISSSSSCPMLFGLFSHHLLLGLLASRLRRGWLERIQKRPNFQTYCYGSVFATCINSPPQSRQ